jgi:glutathione synthase/RimK-type ligase-like ATP-grasp enzyme
MRGRHVVVYDDLTAQRGEGKRLEFWENVEDDAWIGEYIIATQGGRFLGDESSSWRYLFIGDMTYVLKYDNFSKDWRSNVGQDIEIKLVAVAPRNTTIMKEPLLGIDVVTRGGIYYAIDYNDAPGLADSPLSYLSANVIIEQLCRWMYKGEK